nr:22K protein [Lemur mastadenovirus]
MAQRNQIMREEEEDSMSESGYVTVEESADDSLPSPRTPSPLPAGSRLTDSLPPASPRKPRWDQVATSNGKQRNLKTYKSWRRLKYSIMGALQESGGNAAFVRRYLLFKEGTLVPKSVIAYYNSCYRRCGGEKQASQEKTKGTGDAWTRLIFHQGAERQNLSHSVRHFPAESRQLPRTEN